MNLSFLVPAWPVLGFTCFRCHDNYLQTITGEEIKGEVDHVFQRKSAEKNSDQSTDP
jgi:hypothetical protein